MPRVFKHGNVAQKHKPFKGSKKSKQENDHKVGANVHRKKLIHKAQPKKAKKQPKGRIYQRKEQKQLQQMEKKLKANSYLDSNTKAKIQQLINQQVGVKVVVLIPFNKEADVHAIKSSIQQYIQSKTQTMGAEVPVNQPNTLTYPYFNFFAHPKNFPGLVKQNFTFIAADRNIESILDYCKVADIICPVLSCRGVNTQGIALDPYQNAKAFDDDGYTVMNILKHQGIPCTVSVIQHLELVPQKQYQNVSRLFRRYFVSQFGEEQKIVSVSPNQQQVFGFLRALQNIQPRQLIWRQNRGYMLAQSLRYNGMDKSLQMIGFLKGNCVNANQIVHLTGIDDFQIQKIQILKSKSKLARVRQNKQIIEEELNLVQNCTLNDQLYPFHRISTQHDPAQLTGAFQGLTLSTPVMQTEQQVMKIQQSQDQQLSQDNDEQPNIQDKLLQKKNRIEMQIRGDDQMEFEDEIDYPADIQLREQLAEYRGLASFRKTEWNQYENLPDSYSKIYVFKDLQKSFKTAMIQNKQKGFAYPGFYIKVTLKNVPLELLQKHGKDKPLIASFLLKHQRKMTMVHLRVKRNQYYPSVQTPVQSNKQHLITIGFRRFFATPIFSKCFNGCDKTKFRKSFVDYQNNYLCSFYYYNTYPPASAAIYQLDQQGKVEIVPIMTGELCRADPMHVALQRVILTGYPFKINKRRATVRYMFFNPQDVKYFKPVQLITKLGLRGNIEQSLGTHGLMKCFFNDKIKPNDTICLYLYKRVFPKAPF